MAESYHSYFFRCSSDRKCPHRKQLWRKSDFVKIRTSQHFAGLKSSSRLKRIRNLSNDDGDGNENIKKAIASHSKKKKTTLHVRHSFLHISLPLPYDYDVKMPNFV